MSTRGWLAGGCPEEKRRYTHQPPSPLTPHLAGTLKDGKAVHTCTVFSQVKSSVRGHTITLCPGKRLSFYERAEQFGNLATLAALEAGCHAARWLCWPVTNSNCPHKKLQVAAPPLSAHLQPLTPHPQRGSIRGGISAGDEQICPNFPAFASN